MKLMIRAGIYNRIFSLIRQANRLRFSTMLDIGTPQNEIAIIGAGISGLGALRGMASQFNAAGSSRNVLSQYGRVSIHVFEKDQTFGNGYPYSGEHMEPEHLINMPLDSMSLYPNDFYHWLEENDERIRQHIENVFSLRFQKAFYNLFCEPFDAMQLDRYKEKFGDAFLELYRKNKEAYKAFESRYLCILDPQFYAPRIVYGMYLQDSFLNTVNTLKTLDIKIALHSNTEVLDLCKDGKNITLFFKNNTKESSMVFNAAILATGHWVKKEQYCSENYFPAWSSKESMQRIDKILQRVVMKSKCQSNVISPVTARIAILGSSLSAIDAIKVIFQEGVFTRDSFGDLVFTPPNNLVKDNDGKVHVVRIKVDILSRNGLMPKVRGQYGSYKNIYLTKENIQSYMAEHDFKIKLEHVMLLLKKDLENAYMRAGLSNEIDWKKILSPTNRGFKQLKKDLEKAVHGDCEQGWLVWQTVYHQASDLFIEIYKHLPAEDKLSFDLFLSTAHFIHIAPMPQYVAEELMAMHRSGVIEARVLGTSSKHAIKHDDSVEFVDIDGKTHSYDATIVATGQHKDVTNNPTSLFKNIIQRELLTTSLETVTHQQARFFKPTHHATSTHYNTGQVRRTPNMELIDHHHAVQDNIYIIGVASSAFGISRASRSLLEGRDVGVNIVKKIAESIKNEKGPSVTGLAL